MEPGVKFDLEERLVDFAVRVIKKWQSRRQHRYGFKEITNVEQGTLNVEGLGMFVIFRNSTFPVRNSKF